MSWLGKLFPRSSNPGPELKLAEALAAWNAGDHGVALDLWAPLAHRGEARAHAKPSQRAEAEHRAEEELP